MQTGDLYVVAGLDLRPSIDNWLGVLNAGEGESNGLLELAIAESDSSYGAAFLMANIGPRAANPTASDEELLLFAVLSLFQEADFLGSFHSVWEGIDVHLTRAFVYFRKVGPKEAARRLRYTVLQGALEDHPEAYGAFKRRHSTSPSERAYWDRVRAAIDQRSMRAADILDPDGDLDSELQRWFDSRGPKA